MNRAKAMLPRKNRHADSTFTLKIERVTPRTLPMRQLLAYLAKLADLFGHEDHVHFVRVAKGSAMPLVAVDESALAAVRARLHASARDDGPPELVKARRDLNSLLRDNETSARLIDPAGSDILVFPGCKTPICEEVTVTEQATLRGVVKAVGGRDNSVPVLLEVEPREYRSCSAPPEIAREIVRFYEQEIEVEGRGKWRRDRDGEWRMEAFRITEFGPLQDRAGVVDTLRAMDAVQGSGWNDLDDPLAELDRLRHGG